MLCKSSCKDKGCELPWIEYAVINIAISEKVPGGSLSSIYLCDMRLSFICHSKPHYSLVGMLLLICLGGCNMQLSFMYRF